MLTNLRLGTSLRLAARGCRNYLLFFSGLLWWAKWRLRRDGSIVVLMFHRVLSATEHVRANSLESTIVREETFARLAQYLRRHCEVVDLTANRPLWNRPTQKPRVALTFDDGWMDNATTALPIARKYDLPFTIFLCPALMETHQPFWPERVISHLKHTAGKADFNDSKAESIINTLKAKQPDERDRLIEELAPEIVPARAAGDPVLTWASVEEMQGTGLVSFGSHTRRHELLTQVSPETTRTELVESKRELEDRLRTPCSLLAYPNGNVSDDVCRQAKAAGYSLAFTTECSPWTPTTDPMRVPRTNAAEDSFVGPVGRFSRMMVEYTLFWRAYRAGLRQQKRRHATKPPDARFRRSEEMSTFRLKGSACVLACALAAVFCQVASAQAQDAVQQKPEGLQLPPLEVLRSGPRLLGASLYATYYSNGVPEGVLTPGLAAPPDASIGGTAIIGYSWAVPRTTFGATYSGSYTSRLRYTSSNMTHSFDAHVRHSISPRLMIDASFVTSIMDLDQFQFTQTPLAALTSASASFNDLAGAVTRGVSANLNLDSLLSSAQTVALPPGLLYGTHTATSSLRTGVTRLRSPRTTWSLNAVASRTQTASRQTAAPNTPSLPQLSSFGAQAALSYSISPRTQFRTDLTSARTVSQFDNSYTHTATAALSQTIGQSWFASVQSGAGFMTTVRGSLRPPTGPQYLAHGILGFTTHNHTFTASHSRTLGGGYSYGAFSTQTTQGAWQWTRPGSAWSTSASFQRQTMEGGLFGGTHGWQLLADVSKTLRRGVICQLGYAYLHSTIAGASPAFTFTQGMLRATFRWGT